MLIIDETHTLSCGPGGYTGAYGLEPDAITMGKPIAGGIPTGAYGLSDELADRVLGSTFWDAADVGGVGGTLAGNALQLAAVRATLGEVLTAEAYERMIGLAERYEAGVNDAIERHSLDWSAVRLGCRVEYMFSPEPPRNGAEARRRDRGTARRAHAPLHAQRGDPVHPVPHDGADLAGDDGRAGRCPQRGLRPDRRRAGSGLVSGPGTIVVAAPATVELAPSELDAATVVSGSPRTFEGEIATARLPGGGTLATGVWRCTEGTVTDVEADETFVVLSGRATIEHDGERHEVGPGDVCVLPAGAATRWTIHETITKVFVIVEKE